MKKIWNLLMINKFRFSVIGLLLLGLTGTSAYLLYSISLLSGIETFLRLCGSIAIIIIWLIFILSSIKIIISKKRSIFILYICLLLIYGSSSIFISYTINQMYSKIDNISNNYSHYSSSIVTLKDNETKSIDDIGDSPIGILDDDNSVDGYQIPMAIVENNSLKNELISYDNFITLIHDLYDKKIDYIFLPTNYVVMFKNIEGLEDIESKTKIIHTEEQKIKKKKVTNNTPIDKPFTILLMGVDSVKENIKDSSFNGDALMLLTFNPNTLNTTLLSIPRDTYVPIACFSGQRKNKITHAAWYGEDCMIETIENFTNIKIDYYLKINFKGVVKLVDSLGGVDIDVPIDFCEQDSNRNFNNEICLNKGPQTLDGEEALALSRHRHTINDFVRGQNQQLVIRGIMNKAKDIRSLDTVYKLLDTISTNMETNMATNQILSFYNIGKDILAKSRDTAVDELLGIQRLYISGYDRYIYDYNPLNNQGMKIRLYNFIPYKGSVEDVVEAMKINLELQESKMIKEFSFDVNEPYEEIVIGKGYYNEGSIALLPDFNGEDKNMAINYGQIYGIEVNISYVSTEDNNYEIGQIINQDIPASTDIDYVNTINIEVVDEIIENPDEPADLPNCSLEENKDHESCKLPDFIGQDYSIFTEWKNINNYSILISEIEVTDGDDEYDADKAGQIIYQSKEAGISIFDLIDNSLEIKYIAYNEETEVSNNVPDDETPEVSNNQESDNSTIQ